MLIPHLLSLISKCGVWPRAFLQSTPLFSAEFCSKCKAFVFPPAGLQNSCRPFFNNGRGHPREACPCEGRERGPKSLTFFVCSQIGQLVGLWTQALAYVMLVSK